ncbi:MAG: biopolymer transporter ExbD [Deltaproteobacteria bacterium]|nr:biopolymer transporter ExbD [Deltaproteobacteria bacterium]
MAASLGDDQDEISGINVTPLVDVVLVLLVIFMITAPTLYQNALNVQLPQAQTGSDQTKTTMQIVVNQAGDITVDKKPYTLEALGSYVEESHPVASIIMADKKTEHGRVISVIDLLKAHGVQKFSFGVERQ